MHHGSDKHLACGNEVNKDSCEVMAITVYYGMTTIMLHNLYFVFSCQPTPLDALSISYE
jgi:hypothetical protein